jgi:uncharacterized membrane protein YeaQ/YmgE (transglycosylase-associated protein family)
MTILAWVVLGLISGFIASMLVDDHGVDSHRVDGRRVDSPRTGVALDTVLGIAGAIIGGLVFTAVGAGGISEFNLWSLFVATVGAALVLAAYHTLARHRGLV